MCIRDRCNPLKPGAFGFRATARSNINARRAMNSAGAQLARSNWSYACATPSVPNKLRWVAAIA
eukprot:6408161-Lingulodinium_polyedra.AAC.1